MSEENVEVVLQAVEATNGQDADAFVALVSEDVEWEDALFWTDVPRTYRGRTELREWFNLVVLEPWERLHVQAEETVEAPDDRVFSGLLLTARGRDSGVETKQRAWQVFWLADGEIKRREVFLERTDALEAAGLSG